MANYQAPDTEFTAVANAIRTKGGTSAQLEWPQGFVDAVGAISGGGSTLITKNITANGTYNASDDSADGYSSVTVNVSGGSDVTLLTLAQWTALSTAEKQAYGLVAIQKASSGYERGILVNGADYEPIGIYLPYSSQASIICEAYPSIFDASAASWGVGDNPIQITGGTGSIDSDGAVEILTYTDGTLAYVDLGEASAQFTAYIVGKVVSASSAYTRLLSAMNARSNGRGILLYGSSNVNVSSWGSDTQTEITSTSLFAAAIQFADTGAAKGTAIADSSSTPTFISKAPTDCGRYLTIGRTDIVASTTDADPSDMAIKYFAVTTEVESETVITQNLQYLASQFIEQ